MLISSRSAGLANRIKCMVGSLRRDPNCLVSWPKIPTKFPRTAGKYCDLFSFPPEIKPPFPSESTFNATWELPLFETDFPPKKNKFKTISFCYHQIPPGLINKYSSIFQQIIFAPQIEETVARYAKQFGPNTVSVHIRTWSMDAKTRQALYNKKGLDAFLTEMKKHDKKTNNFFVSSDIPEVCQKLKTIYGKRIIYTTEPKNTFADDLVDLILLSKNTVIIGSKLSVFTEVAWWLSANPLKTKVIII